ncbi:helix-turn-helix domain-containing protein [Paraflavitalea sp. CAU 1676]|uniref:helix-turn-helix domain-containing protein n=1 Tax=Paraflavitalea sp. CAU 1676 TaxID=3032598 RepID=UPI0023DB0164|nr:helix-turn-helix domain-containing protein [Paraflavitalea sp. CAU 1676]MDF2189917.1 helix-turn-helix domain-containing protein [Paraflavitalea sp. CAU 1676]
MNAWAAFGDTVILLGIVQGFVLSALLFRSRRHQPANQLLSALIGLITLACLNIYFLDADWPQSNKALSILANALPLVVIMPMGPLIYLYVRASTQANFQLTRDLRVHFYPVLIDLLPYILVLTGDLGLLTGGISPAQRSWISNAIDQYDVYADIPRWISVTAYCWQARKYLTGLQSSSAGEENQRTVRWMQQFLLLFLVFQAIWFCYLVPYSLPATRQPLLDAVGWYPIFVPLAILIYWLGLKGYLISYTSAQVATGRQVETSRLIDATASRLPDTITNQYVPLLIKVMEEEKLFLDPSLTVNGLAGRIGVQPKTVSALINQQLNKSFSSFINEYRVGHFKDRVLQQDAASLTISGIAAECGFPSPATFQRVFKQVTGITPSQYIQEARHDAQVLDP